MSLTFDEVDKIDDLPRKSVPIEEWGGDVIVRRLRATERCELEERFTGKAVDPREFRMAMLQKAAINEDGTPWLANGQAEKLMSKCAPAVEKLFDAAIAFNSMGETQDEEAKKN